MTAKLMTPGRVVVIDLDTARLARAREFGADVTTDNGHEDAVAVVKELTHGLGADVAIDARAGRPQDGRGDLCRDDRAEDVDCICGPEPSDRRVEDLAGIRQGCVVYGDARGARGAKISSSVAR